MKKGPTPEEKLLRLIRGQKSNLTLPAAQLKKQKTYTLIPKQLDSLTMRKALWAIFALNCVYLVVSLAYPLFIPQEAAVLKLRGENTPSESITLVKDARPYEFYSAAIKNRQIFGGSGLPSEASGAPVILGDEQIKEINLVGIVSGDNPQAVVEDKKTQKTYYVSKNQFIGQFQVEDIQEGKIILSYNGNKYEIYL